MLLFFKSTNKTIEKKKIMEKFREFNKALAYRKN